MKRGIFVAPFDELADPRLLAELARDAERAGFDGFFLWDHVDYRAAGRGARSTRGSAWRRSPSRPSAS